MEFENLVKLINAVSASEVTGFQYEQNGMKLKISKANGKAGAEAVQVFTAPTAEVQAPAAAETAAPAADGKIISSPLVGTFYAAPSEDAKAFAELGDTVKKGQTLAIVEAMKLMNEIESEYDGVIEEIYVENGQAVEFGQPLFRLK